MWWLADRSVSMHSIDLIQNKKTQITWQKIERINEQKQNPHKYASHTLSSISTFKRVQWVQVFVELLYCRGFHIIKYKTWHYGDDYLYANGLILLYIIAKAYPDVG